MSSWNDQDLFGSGPHEFIDDGRRARHQEEPGPASGGARLRTLGTTARWLRLRGRLIADDADGLGLQLQRIEEALGQPPATLIDDRGREYPKTILVHFKPGGIIRMGTRLGLEYEADWRQE